MGRVLIAGSGGMVGSSFVRHFSSCRTELAHWELDPVTRDEVDFENVRDTKDYIFDTKPNIVVLAAAKVGGILANSTQQVDFFLKNIAIETNIISACAEAGVDQLLFLGSSCIYPPPSDGELIVEESLLSAPLEKTNEGYALAKICGVKLCTFYRRQHGCDFRSVMPCNIYGPGDRYDDRQSHVIPGLIRRIHEAKRRGAQQCEVWGSGLPRREFLFVDDVVEACSRVMNLSSEAYGSVVGRTAECENIGNHSDISIAELADQIKRVIGFEGTLVFNNSLPDGVPSKKLDITRLSSLGWMPRFDLEKGLRLAYDDFLQRVVV